MNFRKTLLISNLSNIPGNSGMSASKRYNSTEYIKKSIKYLIIGALIGFIFVWVLTLDGSSIDSGISVEMSKLIIIAFFGYLGFSFHAAISLIDPEVSFVTLMVLFFTGLLFLIFAFATAIGVVISIPRFIINLQNVFK